MFGSVSKHFQTDREEWASQREGRVFTKAKRHLTIEDMEETTIGGAELWGTQTASYVMAMAQENVTNAFLWGTDMYQVACKHFLYSYKLR